MDLFISKFYIIIGTYKFKQTNTKRHMQLGRQQWMIKISLELQEPLFGDNCCLTKGGCNQLPPSQSCYHTHFHPTFNQFNLFTLFLNNFWCCRLTNAGWKGPCDSIFFFYCFLPNCICLLIFVYFCVYIYIYIYIYIYTHTHTHTHTIIQQKLHKILLAMGDYL